RRETVPGRFAAPAFLLAGRRGRFAPRTPRGYLWQDEIGRSAWGVGHGAFGADPCAESRAVRGDGGASGAGGGGEWRGERHRVAARPGRVDGRGAPPRRCRAEGLAARDSAAGEGSGGDGGISEE